ncbi:hypothetical protein CS078_14055 [Pseudomonas prosekii]|nr:hypothetical protein CS078_14055 [Pseudomonas prosekii]
MAVDQTIWIVNVRSPSRAGSLLQVRCSPQIPCGSELARDGGGSDDTDSECAMAIASKLAPTGPVFATDPLWE